MKSDQVGRYQYGYRYTELDPNAAGIDQKQIKEDLKIIHCRITELDDEERIPLSRTLPIYFDFAQPIPDCNHQATIVMGLLKRAGTKPPEGSEILRAALRSFTRRYCEEHLKPLAQGSVDFYNWIESTDYSRARKDELIGVWEKTPDEDPRTVPKGIEIGSFIKFEHYPTPKTPRIINARDDYFKDYSGPLFDAIGTEVFNQPEFIKTVPVLERPDDILEALYDVVSKVLNCDACSYEAHFIELVMQCVEFEMYRYMTEGVPEYRKKMEVIIEVLSGGQKLKFKHIMAWIMATRMSGEMNTSLGNGFTTMILNKFIAFIRRVIVKLRAEGDDNLSAWQSRILAPTKSDWEELGWLMKVEEPNDVTTASFCGNVFSPEDKIVVTNPVAVLAKLGWVDKKYVKSTESLRKQLLRSKGLSLAHQYNGCPILSKLGRKIVALTRGVRIRESIVNNMDMYKRELYRKYINDPLPEEKESPMATRLLVEELYNITIADQLAIEAAFDSLYLDCCVSMPIVCPPEWYDNYELYTSQINQEWQPPRVDRNRLRDFLGTFGATTRGFMSSYYRL